eukprot:13126184-Alexandrium_andersonii.AAC.1
MTTPSARVPCSRPGSLGGAAGPASFRRPAEGPPARCPGRGWLGLLRLDVRNVALDIQRPRVDRGNDNQVRNVPVRSPGRLVP